MKKYVALISLILTICLCVSLAGCGCDSETDENSSNAKKINNYTGHTLNIGENYSSNQITVTFKELDVLNVTEGIAPSDGKVFVSFVMTMKNDSAKDIKFSILLASSLTCDDTSVPFNVNIQRAKGNSMKVFDGRVAKSQTLTGTVVYEVPKNWENVKLVFSPDFWPKDYIEAVASSDKAVSKTVSDVVVSMATSQSTASSEAISEEETEE